MAVSDSPVSLTTHYAQRVAAGVDLPARAAHFFSQSELAVLGAIRDVAYNDADNTCSLSVQDIARLVEVHPRTAARAISLAIAAGLIERNGNNIINRGIDFTLG